MITFINVAMDGINIGVTTSEGFNTVLKKTSNQLVGRALTNCTIICDRPSESFTTVLETTVEKLVGQALAIGQSLIDVTITNITCSGDTLLIEYRTILKEQCISNCEDELNDTTIGIDAFSLLDEDNYIRSLQVEAANTTTEGCCECPIIAAATLTAVVTVSEPIVTVTTSSPTSKPSAILIPTTVGPTAFSPTAVPTMNSPSTKPTTVQPTGSPSARPTSALTAIQTQVPTAIP